jgi:hypothetical protein
MTNINVTISFMGIGPRMPNVPVDEPTKSSFDMAPEKIQALLNCLSIHDPESTKSTIQNARNQQYFYRTSHPDSRTHEDIEGNIWSGNSEWELGSTNDTALHFAEFHSDKENRKDTPLISMTCDPFRALKAAYWEWRCTPFEKRETKAKQIYITLIQTTDYYLAKELKSIALTKSLRKRLSKEACNRLEAPNNEFLHDSEAVCFRKIPKEDIKHRITFEDLLQNGLLDKILPELDEQHALYKRPLCPAEIRRHLTSCNHRAGDVCSRFKDVYCLLSKFETGTQTQRSLTLAQQLMRDDPCLDDWIKEPGIAELEREIEALNRPKARRIVARKARGM